MSDIKDGFSTQISFASAGSGAMLLMHETEVTPPGVSGGGAIDITTMDNTTWRTFSPKSLKTLSPASFVARYDPAVYDDIVAMINVNQQITVTFPDDSTLVFYGWLDEFTPQGLTEGEMGLADCTIQPSMLNGSGDEDTSGPTFSA